MTIRFTAGAPSVPPDQITYADLYTLPASVRRHGWGVRIPHAKAKEHKPKKNGAVRVHRFDGGVANEILLEQVYANRDFLYWTTMATKASGAKR